MGQPHFGRLRLLRQICRFIHGHVLILSGLRLFAIFAVHAFADKQIRMVGILRDDRHRTGIGTIGNLQSLAIRTKHHIRGVGHAIQLQGLSLLQTAPGLHRHILGFGPLHIETACPRNGDGITIAGDIVVHPVGIDHIRSDMKLMSVFFQFDEF